MLTFYETYINIGTVNYVCKIKLGHSIYEGILGNIRRENYERLRVNNDVRIF